MLIQGAEGKQKRHINPLTRYGPHDASSNLSEFLIDGQPYLSGYKEVPNRPHLIVVPNTLIPQWKHSLTCWLKQGSADVLVYAEGKREKNEFWATNGPYESSLFKNSGELHCIVILASKEVISMSYWVLGSCSISTIGSWPG